MDLVFFHGITIDQYIINISSSEIIKHPLQDVFDKILETQKYIGKTKRYDKVFI